MRARGGGGGGGSADLEGEFQVNLLEGREN